MKILTTIQEVREIKKLYPEKSIGFVPTMGALHEGHASLLRRARKENDIVVLSIFVNPTQFGPKEDFSRYPRTFPEDSQLAENEGVDYIFYPEVKEIYPPGYSTAIQVANISEQLCGKFRPNHFQGVATVVYRLFQIVQPTRSYFGAKDIQQCLVIHRMVIDLLLPVQIIICETCRESDGLAMSSRNRYLSEIEREKAPLLWRVLQGLQSKLTNGESSTQNLLSSARAELAKEPAFQLQYFEILSYPNLEPIAEIQENAVAAVAIFLGNTRLIDNLILQK